MRLERVSLHRIGALADVDLDLTDRSERVVAITGPNGAGKSTLLEAALPGALYRRCPTRGTLASLATSRDSRVRATIANGRRWVLDHSLDSISGKSECLILDDAGAPVTSTAKVREADAWVARHMPPPEVLYASIFGAQGSAGLLALGRADRMGVILRALGVERYEALAARAREEARGATARLDTARARLVDEQLRSGDVATAELAEREASAAAERCAGELAEARAALEAGQAEAAQIDGALRDYEAAIARLAEDRTALADANGAVTDLAQRIANNWALLGRAGIVREAVAEVEALKARRAELVRTSDRCDADRVAAEREYDAKIQTHAATVPVSERARRVLRDREAIAAAAKSLDDLRFQVSTDHFALTNAEARCRSVEDQRIAGAEDRIGALRDGLKEITPECTDPVERARLTLYADDRAVRATELPAELQKARAALAEARETHRGRVEKLNAASALAARAPEVERAEADLASAERDATEASAEAKRLTVLTTQRFETQEAIRDLDRRLDAATKLAAEADQLARAEARLAELEPQHTEAVALAERLRERLVAAPEPQRPLAAPELAPLRAAVSRAESEHAEASARLAVARDAVARARGGAERVAELDAERLSAADVLADWTRLAADLGRDGIQAALVDAACPEIAAAANDLLHTAFGPRFTLRLETQRLGADAKRLIEDLEIIVIDTEGGREAPAETYSGGEKVILSEALSLALTAVAARQAGLVRPTIVRDEAGAALDPGRARAWVAMVRRCVDLIGADRALIVSHSAEVQELCDARFDVSTGAWS